MPNTFKANKTEWNFASLFLNDNDKNIQAQKEQVKDASYKFINKWKDRTDFTEDPQVLKEALEEYEEWLENFGSDGDFGYYFSLRLCLNESDDFLKKENKKIREFRTKIANDIQFFTYRISKIPQDQQKKFLDYPGLKKYRHLLKWEFDNAKYLLSEKEEQLLNLVYPAATSNWTQMVSEFINREEREVLTEDGTKQTKSFSQLSETLNSTNKEVRDDSARAFNEIVEQNVDVATAEINSILEVTKNLQELRGVTRPDLLRHLGDDIDSEVVDALVETVSKRHKISHDYYKLKAQLLNLEKLEYHERNVPYGEVSKKYTYDQALHLVYETLSELDPEFGKIIESYNEFGAFDVYPKKGKSSGAFCAHGNKRHPTYILLNFNNELRDVLTLAHELGHGINNEFIKKNEPEIYFGTSTATAEVASTFMEDFVFQKLLTEVDDEGKLLLLMSSLGDDISSINRQVAAYQFEYNLHMLFRKELHLSKEEIGNLFSKYMSSYMGPYVNQSPGSQNWWVYWSHFRYFFYVYSYASGLLISKALQAKVKQDSNQILNVKKFLSVGTSKSPKDIFNDLGVDITNSTFWETGMDEVERKLTQTIDLAKKLGKIS